MNFNWLTELKRLWRQLRKQGLYLTMLAGIDKLFRMFGNRPAGRYNRIVPKIILGGQPARRHLIKLAQSGVTGIINMREEYGYKEAVGPTNMNYLQLPTIDNTAPMLEDLHRGVDFIQKELENGGSVYIHCWEGLGRGPSMVAAYFVRLGDQPGEAWQKIRAVRPFIRPTLEQINRIAEFAEEVKAAKDAQEALETILPAEPKTEEAKAPIKPEDDPQHSAETQAPGDPTTL